MVPNGWEKRDLQGLIHVRHGFAFKSEFFTERGDYILLTPGSFNESGGFKDQGEKTKYYVGDVADGYLLKKGDMLLAMTEQAEGLLGSALFVPENHKYLHNQRLGLVQITAPEQVTIEFLYLFFNAPATRKQITEQSTGTKVKHTSPDRLCSVIGLIPPLPEQKKIAQILSTWDKAITTTEQLLANSQQQKKALMQQLLTGKKRLLDENGVRFSGEWKMVKVSSVCDVRRGASPRPIKDPKWFASQGRGWIRISDVTASPTKELLKTTQYLSLAGANNSVCVNPGDLIMSICGTIGVPKFIGIPACIHDGFVVFRECHEDLDLSFLYHYLSFITEKLASGGQPGTQKNLNTGIVGNTPMPWVSMEEQQKIATVLSNADQEISTLQQKLNALKQEKKALMQQLLTGKRRVQLNE